LGVFSALNEIIELFQKIFQYSNNNKKQIRKYEEVPDQRPFSQVVISGGNHVTVHANMQNPVLINQLINSTTTNYYIIY
jgi:hypothetical protein